MQEQADVPWDTTQFPERVTLDPKPGVHAEEFETSLNLSSDHTGSNVCELASTRHVDTPGRTIHQG